MLESGYRRELGFLAVAERGRVRHPGDRQIHLVLGIALLGLLRVLPVPGGASEHDDEPDLIGPAARIGALPQGAAPDRA